MITEPVLTHETLHSLPEDFRSLYQSAFPPEEKIPYENLTRTFARGGSLEMFYDSGDFVGFCYTFDYLNDTFLVYIATLPHLRGKGYGKTILETMRSVKNGRNMFLVLEEVAGTPEEMEIKRRRRGFYLRNGCVDTGERILSDDVMFDSMGVCGTNTKESMDRTVVYYENVHNGRI